MYASWDHAKNWANGRLDYRISYLPYRFNMTWTKGNLWKGPIATAELNDGFDYKYIVQTHDKASVKSWESGENRSFKLSAVEQYINQPYRTKSINATAKYEFKLGQMNFVYHRENKYLLVLNNWVE